MKAELDLVYKALDKANKSGVFSLDESNQVLIAFSNIARVFEPKEKTTEKPPQGESLDPKSTTEDKNGNKKEDKKEDKKK